MTKLTDTEKRSIIAGRKDSERKIKDMKKRGLSQGKGIEILVSESDIHYDDMGPGYFLSSYSDATTKLPYISLRGYAFSIAEDHFILAPGLNQLQNDGRVDGNQSYKVYGNSVHKFKIDKPLSR